MPNRTIIQNATIITLDAAHRIFTGDLVVEHQRIAAFDQPYSASFNGATDDVIDARGKVLLPGFVQTHIHLCQTLFRGAADDLALIDWLKQRVWPMEAAHTPASLYASAQLGIAELIRGGTTCALTMETVNHTEAVFQAVADTGFRATVGKCMMDAGDDVPAALHEQADASLNESLTLLKRWHGRDDGRIRYCFAPRFAVSCSRPLLEQVAARASQYGVIIHTHASENRDEIAYVEQMTGQRNIAYLNDVGLTGPHVVLAHCIWLDDAEMALLADTHTRVAHCPSSNLKLASGIARISEMLERGISVSLGADGAPCNNRLDMFTEMRTAALLQKVQYGSRALPALTALRMATIEGAKALGLGDQIGSIEIGKRADLMLLNLNQLHTTPQPDLVSTIVYAAQSSDVELVMIEGKVVWREGAFTNLNESAILTAANEQAAFIQDAQRN
ncbi:MAG: 5'-deoxyadenosine deaminase [Acidobacteria bacterium]|nr:5'-deoxyadenosine deaminase [Acidobacteriota bacterium]